MYRDYYSKRKAKVILIVLNVITFRLTYPS